MDAMGKSALMVALTVIGGTSGPAATYDPSWGPAPPAAPFGLAPLPGESIRVPMVFPVLGRSRWKPASYGDLRGNYVHTGIDIAAPKLTPIVAPISGIIGVKRESFWIYGDDGHIVLGTHLNDEVPGSNVKTSDRDVMFSPKLIAGQRVEMGQFLGYVGRSGHATGPHLHFELYGPGTEPTPGRLRNPTFSLKAAQYLKSPKPMLRREDDRPVPEEIRLEGCVRRVDRNTGTMTLILTDVQYANGGIKVVTKPTYRRVKLSQSVLEQIGWWEALEGLSRTQVVSAYVEQGMVEESFRANRLVLDVGPVN